MNLAAALDRADKELARHGIADARLEAELLLNHALGWNRTALIMQGQRELPPAQQEIFDQLLARRLAHEPTAYILGCQPFMGLDFLVDRSVLIPRPETELLAEAVISSAGENGRWLIVDVGTGSGCLAVSLAKHLPGVSVIGLDSSPAAIATAKKNASRHGVNDHCRFLVGDLLGPLSEKADIIVANPPYIPSAEIDGLQPEVREWEPRAALDGGPDGLDYIRELISASPGHLRPGGQLFLEFGFGQAARVAALAQARFRSVEISNDYAGIPRLLKAL